ncbi:MAG: 3-dehydroquinate synthase, partial [Verrucomicrobiales bacterium]|nr:3-dehydroquinate synthase [Verrucomicrobiales bacterium]
DLPTVLDHSISTDNILDIMKSDKKFKNGKIRFVILHQLGRAELTECITEADIKKAIDSLRG